MGGGFSYENVSTENDLSYKTENALSLSVNAVTDVKRILGLLADDAPNHCIQMHIKYFRHHPQYLERFCGRPQLPEPKHYSPLQLMSDKQFADRSVIHGLALAQVLRCSWSNGRTCLGHLASGLAHAHSGMNFTSDILKDYADVIIDYLRDQLPVAMTPAVMLSWRQFLYGICSEMSSPSTAFLQYRTSPQLPLSPPSPKQKIIQDIRNTILHDPDQIARTAAWLIQNCQRKILEVSPPLSNILNSKQILKRRKKIAKLIDDQLPHSKHDLCSICKTRN